MNHADKLTRFPFDRLDGDSLGLCNLWGKEQLAVKSIKLTHGHSFFEVFEIFYFIGIGLSI